MRHLTILMADDDADDCLLVRDAFREIDVTGDFFSVENGTMLMDYLNREGEYANPSRAPRPDLILLDLNMPLKNGREVLQEIKENPKFRKIPVVVFTTSGEERDILLCYDRGANSFITKPTAFADLVRTVKSIEDYWFNLVSLPPASDWDR